jgi:hypothetical protein
LIALYSARVSSNDLLGPLAPIVRFSAMMRNCEDLNNSSDLAEDDRQREAL